MVHTGGWGGLQDWAACWWEVRNAGLTPGERTCQRLPAGSAGSSLQLGIRGQSCPAPRSIYRGHCLPALLPSWYRKPSGPPEKPPMTGQPVNLSRAGANVGDEAAAALPRATGLGAGQVGWARAQLSGLQSHTPSWAFPELSGSPSPAEGLSRSMSLICPRGHARALLLLLLMTSYRAWLGRTFTFFTGTETLPYGEVAAGVIGVAQFTAERTRPGEGREIAHIIQQQDRDLGPGLPRPGAHHLPPAADWTRLSLPDPRHPCSLFRAKPAAGSQGNLRACLSPSPAAG